MHEPLADTKQLPLPAKAVQFGDQPLHGALYGDVQSSGAFSRAAVLISHGAGGSMDTPLLVSTAQALASEHFFVLTWNFDYVRAGRAPSAGGKRELPEMAEAVQFLRENCPHKPIILIGKSFGGRLGSYLGAQSTDVAGYVFLGLPIKGLGKNPKPRDWSHLSKLRGRALFITGDKDRLCPLDELAEAQKHLQIPFQSTIVPGDHSFKPKGAEQALRKCIDWIKDNF